MKADRELAMAVAFYLSKFGTDGLHSIGYQSYRQAFDEVGSQLNVNPIHEINDTTPHQRTDEIPPEGSHSHRSRGCSGANLFGARRN